jgi:hypothetical protein
MVTHYKKAGVIIWSSSDSYITNAVGESFGEETKIPLNYGDGMAIDSFRNRLHRFKLKSGTTLM